MHETLGFLQPAYSRRNGALYSSVQPGNGVPYVVEYANGGVVIRWLP